MSDSYFQMKDLSVGYHGNVLIHDICTEIKKGEILTLIGPNGSGKSTILKSITKQLTLIGGKVTIGEKNLKDVQRACNEDGSGADTAGKAGADDLL